MEISTREKLEDCEPCPQCKSEAKLVTDESLVDWSIGLEQWEVTGTYKECFSCHHLWDIEDFTGQVEL